MKTQPASRTIDLSAPRTNPGFSEVMASMDSPSTSPSISVKERSTAMRDALSFSFSFAVVALITGAMLFYKVGVTISGVTSFLFYASLAGMVVFAGRAIYLGKQRTVAAPNRAELN